MKLQFDEVKRSRWRYDNIFTIPKLALNFRFLKRLTLYNHDRKKH
jgi:hypothetical protein